MAYRVEYISTFYTDIISVASYLSEYPSKAKRIFETMDRKLLLLPDMPKLYPVYDDFPEFRKIVVEDYLVFYTVNDRDSLIEVHRLIYGGMDVKSQLDDGGN